MRPRATRSEKMRVLLLNQAFYPDYVATAQILADFASALIGRGHHVTAVASSRGYDTSKQRYPTRENWSGVEIRRIWTPGLGKSAKWRRLVDFAVFWLNAARIVFLLPRQDVIVCLTSPPLISTLGTLVSLLKGGAIVPWIMDLNPDEAVAAGWLRAGSLTERLLSTLQNWSFSRASRIIALDRFMKERLMAKGIHEQRIHTDPPWSHDQAVRYDLEARRTFRAEHRLGDKFVVMYSGNHSPCHPLDSVMQAALALREEERFHFLFVGGGSEQPKVRQFAETNRLTNVTCLPYQPIEKLSGSLSSADLHLVVMGTPFVGIVHPCKIYNILSLGVPFLYVGPPQSHVTDLAREIPVPGYARLADHGDVDAICRHIREAAAAAVPVPCSEAQGLGARFSQSILCERMVRVIEEATPPVAC